MEDVKVLNRIEGLAKEEHRLYSKKEELNGEEIKRSEGDGQATEQDAVDRRRQLTSQGRRARRPRAVEEEERRGR